MWACSRAYVQLPAGGTYLPGHNNVELLLLSLSLSPALYICEECVIKMQLYDIEVLHMSFFNVFSIHAAIFRHRVEKLDTVLLQ